MAQYESSFFYITIRYLYTLSGVCIPASAATSACGNSRFINLRNALSSAENKQKKVELHL